MSADEINRIESQLAELYGLIRTSVEKQADMAVAVARIEERQAEAARTQCPAPGLCLELKKSVDSLMEAKSHIAGGWAALTALGAAVVAIAGLLIAYFRR